MTLEDMYTNKYWQDLIGVIISRIGADAFLRLSAAVLLEEHAMVPDALIELADAYTRGMNDNLTKT